MRITGRTIGFLAVPAALAAISLTTNWSAIRAVLYALLWLLVAAALVWRDSRKPENP